MQTVMGDAIRSEQSRDLIVAQMGLTYEFKLRDVRICVPIHGPYALKPGACYQIEVLVASRNSIWQTH